MSIPIVRYLGPDVATFGYLAAEKFFKGQDVKFEDAATHDEICRAVSYQDEEKVYGVVAVENRIDGIVPESVRAVRDAHDCGVNVFGEVVVPVQLYLLNQSGRIADIQRVFSHPKAINQCGSHLRELYERKIPVLPTDSTAKAAEMARDDPTIAAIASERAERLFGLKRVVPESIVDDKDNVTRFWILGQEYAKPTGWDKTAIFLDDLIRDAHGVLAQALTFFSQMSLAVIYPIPVPKHEWEYTFLIEVCAHKSEKRFQEAYQRLKGSAISRNPPILGSYHNVTIPRPGEATATTYH